MDSVLGSKALSSQCDLQVPEGGCLILRRQSRAVHKGKLHLFRRHTSHRKVAGTKGRKVTDQGRWMLHCTPSLLVSHTHTHALLSEIPGNLPLPRAAPPFPSPP